MNQKKNSSRSTEVQQRPSVRQCGQQVHFTTMKFGDEFSPPEHFVRSAPASKKNLENPPSVTTTSNYAIGRRQVPGRSSTGCGGASNILFGTEAPLLEKQEVQRNRGLSSGGGASQIFLGDHRSMFKTDAAICATKRKLSTPALQSDMIGSTANTQP